MAVNIVTGFTGVAHITSDDDKAKNFSVFGNGKYVFDYGKQFKVEKINNNLIRVRDGMLINQGTQMGIELGDYEDVVVDNGITGCYRKDLVVMRYEKNADTGKEKASLICIKGVSTEGTPQTPAYESGNILDGGDLIDDYPLFEVLVESLTLSRITPLFQNDRIYNFGNVHSDVLDQLSAQDASIAHQLTAQNNEIAQTISEQRDQLSAQDENVATLIEEQKQALQQQQEEIDQQIDELSDRITRYVQGSVSGIKGEAETGDFRTGDVVITKKNLGVPTDLSGFTNNAGYIKEITKAMVTTALGYTPPTTNTTYVQATASTLGLVKLYTDTGESTDGTMTRKAITQEIDNLLGMVNENTAWINKKSGWALVYETIKTAQNSGFNISNYIASNPTVTEFNIMAVARGAAMDYAYNYSLSVATLNNFSNSKPTTVLCGYAAGTSYTGRAELVIRKPYIYLGALYVNTEYTSDAVLRIYAR